MLKPYTAEAHELTALLLTMNNKEEACYFYMATYHKKFTQSTRAIHRRKERYTSPMLSLTPNTRKITFSIAGYIFATGTNSHPDCRQLSMRVACNVNQQVQMHDSSRPIGHASKCLMSLNFKETFPNATKLVRKSPQASNGYRHGCHKSMKKKADSSAMMSN